MSPAITHAKAYPFPIPENSYVIHADGYTELGEGDPFPDLTGLTPVLACGSNQSPEQLARKFDNLEAHPIPVLKSVIKDFDAVHSPHFSTYGSIPATLHHHPGVTSTMFTTWLHDNQMARMHQTEITFNHYQYVRLDGISLEMDGGQSLNSVHAYISSHGSLAHDGKPLALEAVPATGRKWREVSQDDVQTLARDRLKPDMELNDFIHENVENIERRNQRILTLAEDALPFTWPKVSVVPV